MATAVHPCACVRVPRRGRVTGKKSNGKYGETAVSKQRDSHLGVPVFE